ncbi:MAG: transketolase C-terminal domain-containing protein, partial [Lysobacteraceae bacterium]
RMLTTGFRHSGPAAVRYPRGGGTGVALEAGLESIPIGQALVRQRGARIALLAFGAMVPMAEKIGLEFDLTVVNMRFIKPLDRATVLELARTHIGFVTLEDNAIMGGAGSAVAELLSAEGVVVPIQHLGLPDAWLEHASREQVLAEAGLDLAGARAAMLARWPELAQAPAARTVDPLPKAAAL